MSDTSRGEAGTALKVEMATQENIEKKVLLHSISDSVYSTQSVYSGHPKLPSNE
jgi:hypothetical protein